jgi:hypothetical protein
MNKIALTALLLILVFLGANAQGPKLKVKITDTDGTATVVSNVSSSSSSSCNTSDFPVYQGTTKTDVDFNDLKKVIIRHDLPAEDRNNYLTVELFKNNGESGLYEMIRNIRITGKSEEGNFSVKVIDLQAIEVLN